jgi:hypothetical protein
LTAAALVGGLVLMLAFDATATRVIGVLCLFAFIAGGTFLIASPEYLSDAEPPPDEPP